MPSKNSDCKLSWFQLLNNSEDTLTSFVFERLFYLPSELLWEIIRSSTFNKNKLPEFSGPLLKKEFWPHWSADSEDISNKTFVEPDVFMRFEKFDLIIEAKKHDFNKQYRHQWENQITAYQLEYQGEERKLFYIALDGLNTTKSDEVKNIPILKSRWNKILQMVKDKYQEASKPESENRHHAIIFEDIIIAFGLHGYMLGDWLNTMKYEHYKIQNSGASLQNTTFYIDRLKNFVRPNQYIIHSNDFKNLLWEN